MKPLAVLDHRIERPLGMRRREVSLSLPQLVEGHDAEALVDQRSDDGSPTIPADRHAHTRVATVDQEDDRTLALIDIARPDSADGYVVHGQVCVQLKPPDQSNWLAYGASICHFCHTEKPSVKRDP